jgi:hypothetical protein
MSSPRPVISPRKQLQLTHKQQQHHQHHPSSRSPSPPPKKRRIDDEEDLDSLMHLYQMAKETMNYCEGRLRRINKRNREAPSPPSHRGALNLLNDNLLEVTQDNDTIGGIPRKFLDLSHFKKFAPQEAHVIADENHHPVTTAKTTRCKHPSNRIHIHNAPLPHVNGTYIQDGTYNASPLFVRVGPPRKFMGKFDCCVVLRRELLGDVGKWKIGLVPSHTITHPRLIGYYECEEKEVGELPVEGWRVLGSVKKVGGLRISYEE